MRFRAVSAVLAVFAVPAVAADRRDPFTSYVVAGDTPTCVEARGVLCVELDSLRLVGVVTGVPSPWALFEDTSGRSSVLKVGDVVGRHRITALRRGQVVLRQQLGSHAEVIVGL